MSSQARRPNGRLGNRSHRRARGFTLIELIVSCAIALVIIIGLEQVFSISSKTIGAGEALSDINRDDRAAQSEITTDLLSADLGSDCPAFMIRSGRTYAFESASDYVGSENRQHPEYDPSFVNLNSANGGTVPFTYYNYRNHRTDRFAFFARNFFNRQTGGTDNGSGSSPSQFVSPTTSNEAYIWYGHVAQPNNASIADATNGTTGGSFFEPGDTSVTGNDNNQYASDWILGRAAIVLDPLHTDDDSFIVGGSALGPLSLTSASVDGKSVLYQSRYDQAYTSIANYDLALSSYAGTGSPYYSNSGAASGNNWYTLLLGLPPATGTSGYSGVYSGRFQATPYPIKVTSSGLTNASLAYTFPVFIRGCTQFIVEYAGNYYTKTSTTDPTPVVTSGASVPDPTGQLDFQIVNGTKQVRWYGFPRHTSGPGSTTITPLTDVVPLGAWLAGYGVTSLPSFERYYPNAWAAGATPTTDFSTNGAIGKTSEYVAAWGPDTTEGLPKMIRITVAMADPNGNLSTPQWFEYVINLQP